MLSSREQQILRAVVNEYLHTAQPVGSQVLRVRYGFGISPATIRAAMSALTSEGFLQQPHTSAGRVPTERAYRLFLENASAAPSLAEQQKVTKRLEKAATAPRAAQKLAEQLSEVAGAAGILVDADGANTFNLGNVFGKADFADPHVAGYLAELLDESSEWLPKLATKAGTVVIRIGSENEDFRVQAVSVMAIKVKVGNYVGYVGIVGPTRMPYQKVAALMEYGAKELGRVYG
jgi:heat-inducible transcriptional repressor